MNTFTRKHRINEFTRGTLMFRCTHPYGVLVHIGVSWNTSTCKHNINRITRLSSFDLCLQVMFVGLCPFALVGLFSYIQIFFQKCTFPLSLLCGGVEGGGWGVKCRKGKASSSAILLHFLCACSSELPYEYVHVCVQLCVCVCTCVHVCVCATLRRRTSLPSTSATIPLPILFLPPPPQVHYCPPPFQHH